MTKQYDDILNELRREISQSGARPHVIEKYLDNILHDKSIKRTKDLLLLLSDNAEYDEGMFSIIHAVEDIDDEKYIGSLLAVFSELISAAPRWASIVLMRTLNSRTTQLELVKQIKTAPQNTKDSVYEMCERINGVSSEFLSKTVPVALAART